MDQWSWYARLEFNFWSSTLIKRTWLWSSPKCFWSTFVRDTMNLGRQNLKLWLIELNFSCALNLLINFWSSLPGASVDRTWLQSFFKLSVPTSVVVFKLRSSSLIDWTYDTFNSLIVIYFLQTNHNRQWSNMILSNCLISLQVPLALYHCLWFVGTHEL